MKTPKHPPQVCERMRKVFNECYCTVQLAEDPASGRRRWELFKELVDKRVCIVSSHSVVILIRYLLRTILIIIK